MMTFYESDAWSSIVSPTDSYRLREQITHLFTEARMDVHCLLVSMLCRSSTSQALIKLTVGLWFTLLKFMRTSSSSPGKD